MFDPYSLESAAAHFAAAGLEDKDGNGFLNHPADVLGADDVQVTLLHNIDYQTDKNLAEGVVAMMEGAGIKVVLNSLSGNDRDAARAAGRYDCYVHRNTSELITLVQNTTELAPTGPRAWRSVTWPTRPESLICCPLSRRWSIRSTRSSRRTTRTSGES